MERPSTNSQVSSVPKPMRTRPVSTAQVRAYVRKAQEYCDAAASELESERNIAATSLAIHAASTLPTQCAALVSVIERQARTTTRS